MSRSKCSSLIVGVLVLAFVAAFSAPAMAQGTDCVGTVCSPGLAPSFLTVSTDRVPGVSGFDTVRIRLTLFNNTAVNPSCNNGNFDTFSFSTVHAQTSCLDTNVVCTKDFGQPPGPPPAVTYDPSLTPTTNCGSGSIGSVVVSPDGAAVDFNFTPPVTLNPNASCRIDFQV